jgi:hypothetical protein
MADEIFKSYLCDKNYENKWIQVTISLVLDTCVIVCEMRSHFTNVSASGVQIHYISDKRHSKGAWNSDGFLLIRNIQGMLGI